MKSYHKHKEPVGQTREKNFFSQDGNSFFGQDQLFFTQKSGNKSILQSKLTFSPPIPVQHVSAHELKHTSQQRSSIPSLQRSPQSDQAVEDCLNQKDGDLLPGQVGVVEQINREVGLEEILGKDRIALEKQIRQNYDARKFVCEAGVSAMMALYYNRDFKKRLDVKRARKSFNLYPEYYSFAGFDQTRQTKEMLQKKYGIFIERGNKEWSPRDIVLLAEALGKLTDNETPLIRNYHFIRWTNRCYQLTEKNPDYTCDLDDYSTCGLHETEVADRKYTITMYDCMGGNPEDEVKPGYNVQPGAETIVHEIGHAMEFGRLRLATEKAFDAKKAYNRIKKQFDNVKTADEKAAIKKNLKAAKKEMDAAEAVMDKAFAGPPLDKFKKLIKGKKAMTDYAKKSATEAFAEAFMLFKVAPKQLKKLNKPLFNWFNQGGFI